MEGRIEDDLQSLDAGVLDQTAPYPAEAFDDNRTNHDTDGWYSTVHNLVSEEFKFPR